MTRSPSKWRVAVLVTLAIVAFAGNSLLARAALKGDLIGPGTFTAIRLAAGAAILLPFFRFRSRPQINWRGSVALVVYAVGFGFAYIGLGTATGALILFAAVQATILAAGALGGDRPRVIDLTGIGCALAGVLVLVGGDVAPGPPWAMASMIVAGIAWGLYSLMGRASSDPVGLTAKNFLLSALLCAPLPLLETNVPATGTGIGLAVLSGAFASGLGYAIWYKAVPQLPHASVGAVQLATPVVAALAAFPLLAEPLTPRLAAAALLILGGIAATLRKK